MLPYLTACLRFLSPGRAHTVQGLLRRALSRQPEPHRRHIRHPPIDETAGRCGGRQVERIALEYEVQPLGRQVQVHAADHADEQAHQHVLRQAQRRFERRAHRGLALPFRTS